MEKSRTFLPQLVPRSMPSALILVPTEHALQKCARQQECPSYNPTSNASTLPFFLVLLFSLMCFPSHFCVSVRYQQIPADTSRYYTIFLHSLSLMRAYDMRLIGGRTCSNHLKIKTVDSFPSRGQKDDVAKFLQLFCWKSSSKTIVTIHVFFTVFLTCNVLFMISPNDSSDPITNVKLWRKCFSKVYTHF